MFGILPVSGLAVTFDMAGKCTVHQFWPSSLKKCNRLNIADPCIVLFFC